MMVISVDIKSGDIISVRDSDNVNSEEALYDAFAHSTLETWLAQLENAKNAHQPGEVNGQF